MEQTLEASLELVNDKMHFKGKTPKLGDLDIDYIPPYGDNLGYMPLELFLMSLGACTASAFLVLLRRMNKTINSLKVACTGDRREQHPTCFSKIVMTFTFDSPDIDTESIEKADALTKDSFCPVLSMVDGKVEIVTRFVIENIAVT